MPEVNYLAVALAALSAFLLGGLWYSPILFASRWAALAGVSAEKLKSGSMAMIFGTTFLLNLVAAFMLALLIGIAPDFKFGTLAGLAVGLCWVATSFGVSYLFERRPLGLWLINAGYFTLHFTVMGAILGVMG
ncbi:MAG TPA: DUF1761 domain-containing protein [Allosphingosinicella sp.]|jgi:hypothetical protein